MKLFDPFPDNFFDGSSQMKKDFVKEVCSSLNPDQLLAKAHNEMDSLIASAGLSSFSMNFCKACFAKAPDEFFILPTSTTGKYHGGRTSKDNSLGGNIYHTSQVLKMSDKVLHRYKELIYHQKDPELLKVSCILHDICKIPPGEVYAKDTHGEDGADFIRYVFDTFDPDAVPPIGYIESITYAVSNHMYLWRFSNVNNQLNLANSTVFNYLSFNNLIIGLMLSECDYYATPFGVF